MSESLVKNLKNMLIMVGKAGSQYDDCPVPSSMYSVMISWIFDDVSNRQKIASEYAKKRDEMEDAMEKDGLCLDRALSSRDRIIFRYIDLFPSWVKDKHGSKIEWFSELLASRVNDKIIEYLCRYIEAMDVNLSQL